MTDTPLAEAVAAMKRYEQLAEEISHQIRARVLRVGDRLPSVRQASQAHRVSRGTVLRAYYALEDRGEIRTRPRSGYYVTPQRAAVPPPPLATRPSTATRSPDVRDFVFDVLEAIKARDMVPFGSAFPSPDLFPLQKLAGALSSATRRLDPHEMVEHLPPGLPELRRQIARRYLHFGISVDPDDIVVTTGAMEALNLSLRAVAGPGDVIAIECPSFYAALDAIERYGMKAVEVPTDPGDGVNLDVLAEVLRKHRVKACWLMTSFQNPVGSTMAEDKKRDLVEMLAARDVALIEDDVYAELYFGEHAPKPAKAFDRSGTVLHCSSFSKCLAPGYRVGWTCAGRYAQTLDREKLMTTIATSIPTQAAIAHYLGRGGYDHHLRGLRRTLEESQERMRQAIVREFPNGTRVSRPEGGYFLWVELPPGCSGVDIYRAALERKITLLPGPVFSPQRKFTNFIRLNYGMKWTSALDAAMARLGEIISAGSS
jgi:DNA-binding transcriptional MocR family regulator